MATIVCTKVSVAVLVLGVDCRLSARRHDRGGGMVSGAIHVSTPRPARQGRIGIVADGNW